MLLDKTLVHTGIATQFLRLYQIVEIVAGQGGDRLLVAFEIVGSEIDHGVELVAAAYLVLKAFAVFAYEIFFEPPTAVYGVPHGTLSADLGYEAVAIHFLEGELVGRVVPVAERLHIGEFARGYLVMDIAVEVVVRILYVLVFELDAPHICPRDDEMVQRERQRENHQGRKHIGQQQAAETDAAGQYGYEFGIRGHPGREYDHRNEDEKRAEHIHIVRDQVQVEVQDYGL